jgi:hypothetical protein
VAGRLWRERVGSLMKFEVFSLILVDFWRV